MNIKFLAAAREEFLAAVEFYEQQEAGLGARLVDSVEKTIETLRQGPHAGVTYSHGTQRLVITHFPFSIVYILEATTKRPSRHGVRGKTQFKHRA